MGESGAIESCVRNLRVVSEIWVISGKPGNFEIILGNPEKNWGNLGLLGVELSGLFSTLADRFWDKLGKIWGNFENHGKNWGTLGIFGVSPNEYL